MLNHVDEVWTRAALTLNTHRTYNEQCATNQILSLFGGNTKEVWDVVWTGLNDTYVCHNARDVCPLRAIDSSSFIQKNFEKI